MLFQKTTNFDQFESKGLIYASVTEQFSIRFWLNTKNIARENAFENVVCKMLANLFRYEYVNKHDAKLLHRLAFVVFILWFINESVYLIDVHDSTRALKLFQ